jgi:hypothetical protein
MEIQATLVHQDPLVVLDPLVRLEYPATLDYRDQLGILVQLDQLELQATLEWQVPLVTPDLSVQLVQQEVPVTPE